MLGKNIVKAMEGKNSKCHTLSFVKYTKSTFSYYRLKLDINDSKLRSPRHKIFA